MYTNLILFLVAIFLFTLAGVPEQPLLPGWQSLALLALLYAGYGWLARRVFNRPAAGRSAGYFRSEKYLSVLALVFFATTLYLCDPKYHLYQLLSTLRMPALLNFAGLLLFAAYLAVMWSAACRRYGEIFDRSYRPGRFIAINFRANLPIVLPWVVLSLLYDLIALLPMPGLQSFFASPWGDLVFFAIFLVVVLLFFPPMVRRLWGCQPLPDGYLKRQLQAFAAKQNFSADIYLWPLFEGRVITAGVMGIVPGLRYILVTPALLETMTMAELEAVMAHEIGHVKKFHLPLYALLIAGFSLLAGLLAEPFVFSILAMDSLHRLILASDISAEHLLAVVGAVPLLLFLVLYFRYVFGYFIRNFERQADLFSLVAIGNSEAMVSAFEKIALLSGNIRDQPNWHHFGIGERIDTLVRAERQPELISRHNRKVRLSLLAYLGALLLAVFLVRQIPSEELAQRYEESFAETVLLQKARMEPERALWQRLLGDLMLYRQLEEKALAAYETAHGLEPANPEVMNNLAWLLLTARDTRLRDPARALTLARGAAVIQPRGYILDTLATAYWANDLVDEAVRVGRQAIEADPAQRRWYLAQLIRFTNQSYQESVAELQSAQESARQAGGKAGGKAGGGEPAKGK